VARASSRAALAGNSATLVAGTTAGQISAAPQATIVLQISPVAIRLVETGLKCDGLILVPGGT